MRCCTPPSLLQLRVFRRVTAEVNEAGAAGRSNALISDDVAPRMAVAGAALRVITLESEEVFLREIEFEGVAALLRDLVVGSCRVVLVLYRTEGAVRVVIAIILEDFLKRIRTLLQVLIGQLDILSAGLTELPLLEVFVELLLED